MVIATHLTGVLRRLNEVFVKASNPLPSNNGYSINISPLSSLSDCSKDFPSESLIKNSRLKWFPKIVLLSLWYFLVPKISCPQRINLLAHGTSVYNISITELYFLDLLTLGGYSEATRGISHIDISSVEFLQTPPPFPLGSVLG